VVFLDDIIVRIWTMSQRFPRLHHHGYACQDINASLGLVAALGQVVADSGTVYDGLQKASLRLLEYADGARVELVSGEMVAGVLKRGPGVYHACFEVADLVQAQAGLRAQGAMPISRPTPAVLFGGRRVVFLMTRLGLIELLEAGQAGSRS
jgi:methylmalonyl-CoA/ethylmalonyl-CoA epimerase